ncbi:hypothetical protein GIB67_036416, partial [Kingdonia uniflora]
SLSKKLTVFGVKAILLRYLDLVELQINDYVCDFVHVGDLSDAHVAALVYLFNYDAGVFSEMQVGLQSFLLPASLIVINDIGAYIFGFFFGRTPLIKLSPKKTWEGFIGASFTTIIFAFVLADIMRRFQWLTCPRKDLSTGWLHCDPGLLFKPEYYSLLGWVPEWVISLERDVGFASAVACLMYWSICIDNYSFWRLLCKWLGFKRAFKIKVFGDSIPGHGGITDRMDCQMVMAVFAYIYHQSFVAPQNYSVEMILDQVSISTSCYEYQFHMFRFLLEINSCPDAVEKMVTTRTRARESQIRRKMEELRIRYFDYQPLHLPIPIPVSPTYHHMSYEEVMGAGDDHFQMVRFYYLLTSEAVRCNSLWLLTEVAVTTEDEVAGIRPRESRYYPTNEFSMRSKPSMPTSKFVVSSSSEETSSSGRGDECSVMEETMNSVGMTIEVGEHSRADVVIGNEYRKEKERVLVKYHEGVIYGLRIPLTYFHKGVMNVLQCCPAQLNENVYEMMRVCEALNKKWRKEGTMKQFEAEDVLKFYKWKYIERRSSGYMYSDSFRPKFFDFESVGRPLERPLEPKPSATPDKTSMFDCVARDQDELKQLSTLLKEAKQCLENRSQEFGSLTTKFEVQPARVKELETDLLLEKERMVAGAITATEKFGVLSKYGKLMTDSVVAALVEKDYFIQSYYNFGLSEEDMELAQSGRYMEIVLPSEFEEEEMANDASVLPEKASDLPPGSTETVQYTEPILDPLVGCTETVPSLGQTLKSLSKEIERLRKTNSELERPLSRARDSVARIQRVEVTSIQSQCDALRFQNEQLSAKLNSSQIALKGAIELEERTKVEVAKERDVGARLSEELQKKKDVVDLGDKIVNKHYHEDEVEWVMSLVCHMDDFMTVLEDRNADVRNENRQVVKRCDHLTATLKEVLSKLSDLVLCKRVKRESGDVHERKMIACEMEKIQSEYLGPMVAKIGTLKRIMVREGKKIVKGRMLNFMFEQLHRGCVLDAAGPFNLDNGLSDSSSEE